MTTWHEVQERVRRDYALDVDKGHEFALTIEHRVGDGSRAQRVMARHYTAWGREMVEVRSAFGEIGDYDAEGLLADSLELPLGSIALHGRFLVLVQKAVLEDVTASGVVFLLTRVSLLADALEERLGRDRF